MSKNDGGPAFPAKCDGEFGAGFKPGMTLRDYFAGQAMATRLENYSETWRELAESSYEIADAMLAERAR